LLLHGRLVRRVSGGRDRWGGGERWNSAGGSSSCSTGCRRATRRAGN